MEKKLNYFCIDVRRRPSPVGQSVNQSISEWINNLIWKQIHVDDSFVLFWFPAGNDLPGTRVIRLLRKKNNLTMIMEWIMIGGGGLGRGWGKDGSGIADSWLSWGL